MQKSFFIQIDRYVKCTINEDDEKITKIIFSRNEIKVTSYVQGIYKVIYKVTGKDFVTNYLNIKTFPTYVNFRWNRQ